MSCHLRQVRQFWPIMAVATLALFLSSVGVATDPPEVTESESHGSSPELDLQREMNRLCSDDPRERKQAALSLRGMGALAGPSLPLLARLSRSRTQASSSDDFEAILTAQETLRVFARSNPELVIALLDHEDERVRAGATVALGESRDPRAIPALMRRFMAYSYFGGASESERALVKIGSPAVDPLIAALQHDKETVRSNAARALGEIGDPRAIEPLKLAFKSNLKWGRGGAQGALERFGAPAVPFFIESLESSSPYLRANAAMALGKIGDQRAALRLISALRDENWRVRSNAAVAFQSLKDPAAREPLLLALEDNNVNVRNGAAISLASIGGPRVLDRLVEHLKNDAAARLDVARALGRLGDRKAVEPLINALDDEDDSVRTVVAGALGVLGDGRAVDPLIKLLNDPSIDTRSGAARALGKIGDKRAVPHLIAALTEVHKQKDSNFAPIYPFAAVRALGEINDPRSVESLITALQHPSRDIGAEAARVLGGLNDPRAIDPLIEAIPVFSGRSFRGGVLSNAAVEALFRLTGKNYKEDQQKWREWRIKQLSSPADGE